MPEGWQGQARALIQQLERIHDDLYNLLGKGDIPEAVQEFMDDASSDIEGLETAVEDIGDEVDTLNGNMQAAQDDIDDLEDMTEDLAESIAIVATGDTHIAVTSGQYVFIRSHETLATGLYRATANIAADGALSASNVSAVSDGGMNDLLSKLNGLNTVEQVTTPVTFDTDYVESSSSATMYKCGKIRVLTMTVTFKAAGSGWQTFGSIASANRPKQELTFVGISSVNSTAKRFRITTAGNVRTIQRTAEEYMFTVAYLVS